MTIKRQTFKQLSEIICVSYRTLLAWRRSRPELISFLMDTTTMDNVVSLSKELDRLQSDNDRLKSIIKSIHSQTGDNGSNVQASSE